MSCVFVPPETDSHERDLRAIAAFVAKLFPDDALQRQLTRFEAERMTPKDALAGYVACELRDLYDPKSSLLSNVKRISASLERSAILLEQVANQLACLHLADVSSSSFECSPDPKG